MKIAIDNMVCDRCIESVTGILTDMNFYIRNVELGSADIENELSKEELYELQERLAEKGFELVFDRDTELVNLVKSSLIQYIKHIEATEHPEKLSEFVSKNTHYNYSYLSKIFSENKGITIETYLIRLKIERVKEMLSFRKWTLSEIAWKLNYSSVQYLSNQFKKVTGMTVTEYLHRKESDRVSIDTI